MPWHNPKCCNCLKDTYVTFTKADGKQSKATRIARGTLTLEIHIKRATHSSEHISSRKTYCCECAPEGLMEQMQVVGRLALAAEGEDPARVVKPRKASGRPRQNHLICPACIQTFHNRARYIEHRGNCSALLTATDLAVLRLGAGGTIVESGADAIALTLRHGPGLRILTRNEIDAEIVRARLAGAAAAMREITHPSPAEPTEP